MALQLIQISFSSIEDWKKSFPSEMRYSRDWNLPNGDSLLCFAISHVTIKNFWTAVLPVWYLLNTIIRKTNKPQRKTSWNRWFKSNLDKNYEVTNLKYQSFSFIQLTIWKVRTSVPEAATHMCSQEKVFWKYAANLKTHAEVRFL